MASPSSRPTRWIVVDDTSPEFTFTGSSWFPQDGVYSSFFRNDTNNVLNSNGQPFNSTTHGTRQPASFSITYTGTQFEMIGTIDQRNNKGGLEWHCSVDGRQVQNNTDITKIPLDNNWFLCGDPDSPSGEGKHTLIANISATTEQPFWFDWMRYSPAQGASLENRMIRYDRPDPDILKAFSSEWDMSLGTTAISGASFQYEFIGTSLAWYGSLNLFNANSGPLPTSQVPMGSYKLNDGPAQPFYCPMVSTRANYRNMKFFDTGTIPMRKNKISVVYTGGAYPFSWDFLMIQNGTLSDLNRNPLHSSNRVQRIVLASVIPVVVLLVLAIMFAWFIRRRGRRKHRETEVDLDESSLSPAPFPLHFAGPSFNEKNSNLSPSRSSTTTPVTSLPQTRASENSLTPTPFSLDTPRPSFSEKNSHLSSSRSESSTPAPLASSPLAGASGTSGELEDSRRRTLMSEVSAAPPSYTP